jgi:hypothetical protein
LDVFLISMNVHLSRVQWLTFAGVALVSTVLGFTGAKILANETIGYLAGYTWFGLMVLGVPLVLSLLVIGAALSFSSKTRWFGGLALSAAVLIVASSFVSFKVLDAMGSVLYKHEQMVSIGPEVKADFVVFFKTDASHDEIERFSNEVLSNPTESGSWPLPGIRMISKVWAVEGHEGYAVNFFPSASAEQRQYVKSRVGSSVIVYRVVEDVIPADIKKVD